MYYDNRSYLRYGSLCVPYPNTYPTIISWLRGRTETTAVFRMRITIKGAHGDGAQGDFDTDPSLTSGQSAYIYTVYLV
jgi:hypothetical protein